MTEKDEPRVSWLRSKNNIALLVFLSIGSYFLLTEHWAHVIQALPYLLVLGCIVMHLFMHGGHGHGDNGSHHSHEGQKARRDKHDR